MPVKASKIHDPDYDLQPGIDQGQMEEDATGWRVTAADVQGPGNFKPLGACSGPFVGDPYSGVSGLGTERAMITYESKSGKGKTPRTGNS
ncbi:MAG: hypothetical protein KGJ13_13080 [Patescibacteria group bacterium]|nr:hypothetical protein [Patescibacteria group bacterium]